MLEACVSWRHNGASGCKRFGDIVSVALSGFPWGKQDKKFHSVIEWDDAELEIQLRSRINEKYPSISYPYAEYTDDEETGITEMTFRSTQRIRPTQLKAEAINKEVSQTEIYRHKTKRRAFKKADCIVDVKEIGEIGRIR